MAEKRHPNRWDLDYAAPEHPVRPTHRSGHAYVLNTMALKLVGLTRETGDPEGGMIERDLKTVERYHRDMRGWPMGGGTTQVCLNRIVHEILKK